ncbi:uncharacterized protein UV8b_07147 [Ustilaginoidea virens]|uniref:Uncharacterized protein n=1 Tax=Ustilaginoidea virens TaxID=1159556 RepID=A0A8E5MKB1_USTVR|nr:uncharacterized protein UV8b_07147 [Ustilaginoidea virens]QUC22906.1 hypothetical protein UV8b_07147 [Ustilaginoidea virens]
MSCLCAVQCKCSWPVSMLAAAKAQVAERVESFRVSVAFILLVIEPDLRAAFVVDGCARFIWAITGSVISSSRHTSQAHVDVLLAGFHSGRNSHRPIILWKQMLMVNLVQELQP